MQNVHNIYKKGALSQIVWIANDVNASIINFMHSFNSESNIFSVFIHLVHLIIICPFYASSNGVFFFLLGDAYWVGSNMPDSRWTQHKTC